MSTGDVAARLKLCSEQSLRLWREAFLAQDAGFDGNIDRARLRAAISGLGYCVDDDDFEAHMRRVAPGGDDCVPYLAFLDVVSSVASSARTVEGVLACFARIYPGASQNHYVGGIVRWRAPGEAYMVHVAARATP